MEFGIRNRRPSSILKDPTKKSQPERDRLTFFKEQEACKCLRWFYCFQICKIIWCLVIMHALSEWNDAKDSQGRVCGVDPKVTSRPYLLAHNNNKLLMCWYECPPHDFSYSHLRSDLDLYHPEPIFDIMALRSRGLVCQPEVELKTVSSWSQLEELLEEGRCARDYRSSVERYPKDGVCRRVGEVEVKAKQRTAGRLQGYGFWRGWVTLGEGGSYHSGFSMLICIVPNVILTLVAIHMVDPVIVAAITVVRSLIIIGFSTRIYVVILDLGVQSQNPEFRKHTSTFVFANFIATIINTGIFIIHGLNQKYHWNENNRRHNRTETVNKVRWSDELARNATRAFQIERRTSC